MRWLASLLLVTAACTENSHSQPQPATCPASAPAPRTACSNDMLDCTYGTTTTCTCSGTEWSCQFNTCPWWTDGSQCTTDPTTNAFHCPCTASDTTCTFSNWEHDCECSCQSGWWSCVKGTIGSFCPTPP